jgi:hypothetical protein
MLFLKEFSPLQTKTLIFAENEVSKMEVGAPHLAGSDKTMFVRFANFSSTRFTKHPSRDRDEG